MARPVNANAAKTRGRVLGAATRLFANQGRDGTSMRAIAAEASVSLATIHHYFDSKQRLYDRCVDQMYEDLAALREELAREVRPETLSLQRSLEPAVRAGFRFARAHQAGIRLVMRTVIDQGELDPARRDRFQMPHLLSGARLLATVLDRPRAEVQLSLQSLVHLTVRYALSTDRELRDVAGLEDKTLDPTATIEDHLVGVAHQLFAAGVA